MNLAMVSPAQRDGELVADLAAEGLQLRKPEVMCVRGLSAADQARLFGHEPHMVLVTNAARFGKGKRALVDAARTRLLAWHAYGRGDATDATIGISRR